RRTVGRKEGGEHRALDLLADSEDVFVVGLTFGTPVVAEVFRVAVVVVFPISLVVPLVETHRIFKREAIVGCQKVDRGPGRPAVAVEDLAGPGKTRRQIAAHAGIAAPEAAHAVAVAVVPFRKARRMVSELIASRPDVPGFRDELFGRE